MIGDPLFGPQLNVGGASPEVRLNLLAGIFRCLSAGFCQNLMLTLSAAALKLLSQPDQILMSQQEPHYFWSTDQGHSHRGL